MAFRKGLCPHCGSTKNIKDHSFMVNMNSDTIFCPKCARKIKPIDAVNKFDTEIHKVLQKSSYQLLVDVDAESAYQVYGMCINLDPENVEGHYGRVVALIYSSKMHKSYIKEVIAIMENDRISLFRKAPDKEGYLKFLLKVNYAVDEYISRIQKGVLIKNCAYDTECLKVLFGRLSEVLELQKLLMEEFEYLSKHYDENKVSTYISFLKSDMDAKLSILKAPIRTVEGRPYNFVKMHKNGTVDIIECGRKVDTHLSKYKMATFDVSNMKLRHIKETVFEKMTDKIRLCNACFVFLILFYTLGVVLCTMSFVMENTQLMFMILVSFAALSLLLAIACTTYFILISSYIKKRKKQELL